MQVVPRRAVDAGDFRPHHPAQQVRPVDALVQQAPAVVLPGAAPGSRVEIGFVAVAAHLSRRMKEPSEGAAVRRGLHRPHGGGEAQLVIDAQAHAVFFCRGDHGVGVLQR
jgi:hypothetical protein